MTRRTTVVVVAVVLAAGVVALLWLSSKASAQTGAAFSDEDNRALDAIRDELLDGPTGEAAA